MRSRLWLIVFGIVILFILLVGGYFIFRSQQKNQDELARAALKLRDEQRVNDLKSLQTAIDLYWQNYRSYPLAAGDKVFVTDQETDLTKKLKGEYLPQLVDDPGNPNDQNWPGYLYWQVDSNTYYLFAKMEDAAQVKNKPLPLDRLNQGTTYSLTVGATTLDYNYWLTNPTSTTPTPTVGGPTPSPKISPSPSPQPAKPVNPGKGKKP